MPIVSLPPVAAAALAAVCLAQAEPVPEQPAAPLPFQLFPLVAIGVLAYLLLTPNRYLMNTPIFLPE